jgi:hypothetical protein
MRLQQRTPLVVVVAAVATGLLLFMVAIRSGAGITAVHADPAATNTPIGGANSPFNSGYNSGFNAGMNSGLNAGMNSGLNAGYNSGLNAGYNSGFNAGYNSISPGPVSSPTNTPTATPTSTPMRPPVGRGGFISGFIQGFERGFRTGFNTGFNSGFNSGFDAGFNAGFNAGYAAGVRSALRSATATSTATSTATATPTPANTATSTATGTPTSSPTSAPTSTLTPGWQDGDFLTFGESIWSSGLPTNALLLLTDNFRSLYPGDALEVGIPGTAGFSLAFSGAPAVIAYLPQIGNPEALNADVADPTSSSSGSFGGDTTALKFNVDFSDAGLTPGSSGSSFGDITLCNLGTPSLNGVTIRDFLSLTEVALGGGSTGYSIADLDAYAADVNASFENGEVSTFAASHLGASAACLPVHWSDGSYITYTQSDYYSEDAVLDDNFNSVYASTFGTLEVGIPGTAGFSMAFSGAPAVIAYLPQIGNPGALNADFADPTSSSSGAFGGEVTALRLNVDFSDAGFLAGDSGLKFGDLTLCNMGALAALNGMSVRQFEGTTETLLGGGTYSYAIADLYPIAFELNVSFVPVYQVNSAGALATPIGVPSTWAQDHLVNGTCP